MALQSMFLKIEDKYELLNHILTFGLDVFWRRITAKECKSHRVVLDLCCGTAQLLFSVSKLVSSNTFLVGVDFTRAMITRAAHKKSRRGDVRNINFMLADAAYLPFRNNSINCIGMSFSFRNLTFRNSSDYSYLMEIFRVLRPRGKFVFVETSQPKSYPLRILLHFYLKRMVPLIGGFISGYKPAYRYLGISAANFPSAEEVNVILEKVGFQNISFRHLTFGVTAIHLCTK